MLVRVHEPLSVLDLLDAGPGDHSWPLPRALAALQRGERGAAVLLNCGEDAARCCRTCSRAAAARARRRCRWTCAPTASARRSCATSASRSMQLLGSPRRMPSMTGYGLEVTGFVADEPAVAAPRGRACRTLTAAAPARLDGRDLRIGIVQARFNAALTDRIAAACIAELQALGVAAGRHPPRPGAGRARDRRRPAGARRRRRARRAGRDRLRHPRRDLPLRAGRQRERRRRHARRRSTTASPSPTPSSPSRTKPRPRPASTRRAATRRGSRSRWPTCWRSCRERAGRGAWPHAAGARTPGRRVGAEVGAAALARVRAAGALRVAARRRRAGVVDAHVREQDDFDKCDAAHFDRLLHGCIGEAAETRRRARRATSTARPSSSRRSSTPC